MQNEQLTAAEIFCTHYNVEFTFMQSLHSAGLIEITTVEEHQFIYTDALPRIEKMVRMHYDLDINLEGIETIVHLLDRLEDAHEQARLLRNRLSVYE